MKIKTILFLSLGYCLMTPSNAAAQDLRWGVEAGLNINMPSDCDTRAGFFAGFKGDISFNPGYKGWFMDYALNLSYIPFGEFDGQHTANPYYLNIPVTAGYRFAIAKDLKLFASGGLFGNIGLFGKGTTKFTGTKEKTGLFDKDAEDFNRFNWGVMVKTGIEFKSRYQLSVSYSHGLNDVSSHGFNHISNLSVGLGYMF